MKQAPWLIVVTAVLVLTSGFVFGCTESESDEQAVQGDNNAGDPDEPNGSGGDSAGSGGEAPSECTETSDYLMLDEEHNYTFSSSIDIQVYPLVTYPAVPTIDWSGITHNILGHEVSAEQDVDYVALIVWGLDDHDTFKEWLNTDSVDMEQFKAAVSVMRNDMSEGTTSASLDAFTTFGTDVDAEKFFDVDGDLSPESNLFLVMAGEGNTLGGGAVMVAFIEPTDSADASEQLELTPDAVTLEYTTDIASAERYTVPMDTADITVDWSEMEGKTNAMGLDWNSRHATRMLLAHYEDATIADLEDQFLDLEVLADEIYSMDIEYSEPQSLTSLQKDDGTSFVGITSDDGVWILALQCTSSGCYNPSPKYLTVLQPCE